MSVLSKLDSRNCIRQDEGRSLLATFLCQNLSIAFWDGVECKVYGFPFNIIPGSNAMEFTNLLGLIAGTFTTAAFIPQLLKTWQSRSARDISMAWLTTFTTGILLWFIYGISIQSLPVTLSNGITLLLTLLILFFKLRFK
jgi:MtN3 and saliva related transmembrane protein